MRHFIKIAFKQILPNTKKSSNRFIIYFAAISLFVCTCALTIAICLSKGFSDQIRLKLSSIDGHYRIVSRYTEYNPLLSGQDLAQITSLIEQDSLFLSYSEYTEDYVLANIEGQTEGLLVYGVKADKALDIFNIEIADSNLDKSSNLNSDIYAEHVIPIAIGSMLAENYNLKLSDRFFVFPIDVNDMHRLPVAIKVQVSYIFNSGFSEYDKSVCFIDLNDSRSFFNYNSNASGIVGTIKNPLEINDNFHDIFKKIEGYRVTSWVDRHESISKWLDVYSAPILFIILLITILAILNMSLSVWILTQDRLKEMSILLTIGFTKFKIFVYLVLQNFLITFLSIFFAGIVSFLLLYFQDKYQLIKISEDVYFIDYLPVTFDYLTVFGYYFFLFAISFLISCFPAFRLYSLNVIKYLNPND